MKNQINNIIYKPYFQIILGSQMVPPRRRYQVATLTKNSLNGSGFASRSFSEGWAQGSGKV
jgi:hypothetical protein